MKLLYTILILLICCTAATQSGEIAGVVLDEKKQPIIAAIVEVSQGGIAKGGAVTGIDGDYLIKPLDAGTYTLTVTYTATPK